MLKQFTKKDKRTDLDKEIESTLVVINKMKAELDESTSEELDSRIESLLDSMAHVSADSENCLNIAKTLDILYKAKASIKSKLDEYSEMVKNYNALCETRNKQQERKAMMKKVIITGGLGFVQLVLALNYEKVDVITTKTFSRLPWAHIE